MATKRQVTLRFRDEYMKASKKDKGRILDEMCSVLAIGRSTARRRLAEVGRGRPSPPPEERPKRYSEQSRDLLVRVWLAAGGVGVAVVVGGIVLAVVLSKRGRRRSRHGGHASGRGPLPPANPYPPQVPGANNGMVPPPAAGQYVPQQQAPHSSAFPRQTPYPAVPYPVPPQQAAQWNAPISPVDGHKGTFPSECP